MSKLRRPLCVAGSMTTIMRPIDAQPSKYWFLVNILIKLDKVLVATDFNRALNSDMYFKQARSQAFIWALYPLLSEAMVKVIETKYSKHWPYTAQCFHMHL